MNLKNTILAAFVVMGLALFALLIGYLLTGKNRLKKGCGMQPKDGSCPYCGTEKECEKKEEKK